MATICVIEDEVGLLNDISLLLKSQNHKVFAFSSYQDFKEKNVFNLNGIFLIDWNLGGPKSGLDILKEIRKINANCYIFMLTANTAIEDVTRALKEGADDYIRKPFSFEELLLKIKRVYSRSLEANQSSLDEIQLLSQLSAIKYKTELIPLSLKEFDIFEKLHINYNQLTTREELLLTLEKDEAANLRNVDVHIHSIRKKIKSLPFEIKTIRLRGYILERI